MKSLLLMNPPFKLNRRTYPTLSCDHFDEEVWILNHNSLDAKYCVHYKNHTLQTWGEMFVAVHNIKGRPKTFQPSLYYKIMSDTVMINYDLDNLNDQFISFQVDFRNHVIMSVNEFKDQKLLRTTIKKKDAIRPTVFSDRAIKYRYQGDMSYDELVDFFQYNRRFVYSGGKVSSLNITWDKVDGVNRDDHQEFFTPPSAADEVVGIAVQKPDIVYDLSCGHGSLLLAALRRWPDVKLYGSDISFDNISYCKQTIPGGTFKVDDLRNITFLPRTGRELKGEKYGY